MRRVSQILAENKQQRMLQQTGGGKVGRNKPCPCGSGLKFKRCHGRTQQLAARKARRKPERLRGLAGAAVTDVPDEAADNGRKGAIEAMQRAGVRPAIVHAYEKTGLWITDVNRGVQSAKDLDAWDSAIDEHNAAHEGGEPAGGMYDTQSD